MIYEETDKGPLSFYAATVEGNGKTQFSFWGSAPHSLVAHFATLAEGLPFTHVRQLPADDKGQIEFEIVSDEAFMAYCFALIDAHNDNRKGH